MKKEVWKWAVIWEQGKELTLKPFFQVSSKGRVWCSGFLYIKKVRYKDKRGRDITKIYKYKRKEGLVEQFKKNGEVYISLSPSGMGKRKQFQVSKLVRWTHE